MIISKETELLLDKRGVYAIVNTADGKGTTYVGSTSQTFRKRFWNHQANLNSKRHGNQHLQSAWNKYGENSFTFSVLQIIDDVSCIVGAEQFWIDEYLLKRNLYNISLKAYAPCIGTTFSDEHRRKLSASLMGHSVSEKTRIAVSERWKTRNKDSKETRWKKGSAFRGKKFSEEHKRKLSESQKGRVFSEETINKMRESAKRKPPMSISTKKKLANVSAKQYPAYKNVLTGEIIPAGVNLAELSRKINICTEGLRMVKFGMCKRYKGWELLGNG